MKELGILLQFAAADLRPVGTLAEDDRRVWFEYDATFAAQGLEISPIRLPLSRKRPHRAPGPAGRSPPGCLQRRPSRGLGLKLLHRAHG